MKLRVWNAINIGSGRIDYYNVDSVKKAKGLINTLADIQLKSENIESNAFGLEELLTGIGASGMMKKDILLMNLGRWKIL